MSVPRKGQQGEAGGEDEREGAGDGKWMEKAKGNRRGQCGSASSVTIELVAVSAYPLIYLITGTAMTVFCPHKSRSPRRIHSGQHDDCYTAGLPRGRESPKAACADAVRPP